MSLFSLLAGSSATPPNPFDSSGELQLPPCFQLKLCPCQASCSTALWTASSPLPCWGCSNAMPPKKVLNVTLCQNKACNSSEQGWYVMLSKMFLEAWIPGSQSKAFTFELIFLQLCKAYCWAVVHGLRTLGSNSGVFVCLPKGWKGFSEHLRGELWVLEVGRVLQNLPEGKAHVLKDSSSVVGHKDMRRYVGLALKCSSTDTEDESGQHGLLLHIQRELNWA